MPPLIATKQADDRAAKICFYSGVMLHSASIFSDQLNIDSRQSIRPAVAVELNCGYRASAESLCRLQVAQPAARAGERRGGDPCSPRNRLRSTECAARH